jgi:hypothetical protein
MRRTALLVAALAAFTALATVHTPAYNISGRRWAVNPVPFYINPANSDVSATEATSAILAAAYAWSTQTVADVSWYYMGSSNGTSVSANGRNEVFFRQDGGSAAIATTYWWTDGSNRLVDADIVFYDGSFRFFTGNTCEGGYFIEDVATHEFGHALGVSHSDVPSATMVSGTGECNTEKRTLDLDDIQAVESLYPPAGQSSPEPPPPPSPTESVQSAPLAASSPNPANGATDVQTNSLSWTPAANATSYEVYFGTSPNPPRVGAVTSASMTVSRLDAGTRYYWRVVALNDVGSATSDIWQFTTRTRGGKGGRK